MGCFIQPKGQACSYICKMNDSFAMSSGGGLACTGPSCKVNLFHAGLKFIVSKTIVVWDYTLGYSSVYVLSESRKEWGGRHGRNPTLGEGNTRSFSLRVVLVGYGWLNS